MRIRAHDDQAAWTTFVEVYSPLVYGFSRLRGLQASDAADVTQEVLLRISKAIRAFEYRPEEGLFRDWLATIVHNEIRRHVGRRRETYSSVDEQQLVGDQAKSQWDEQFHQHVFDVALTRCKPYFTEETWELFERSWLQRQSAQAVAAELQVGVEKVYVARSRVLKRLKHEVATLADDLI